jgi:hypothetical protein
LVKPVILYTYTKKERTMALTVKELIEELKYMDPDAYVHFSYNYGDHWRTQVAPVACTVSEAFVVESAYHNMDKVVEDPYDEDTGEEDPNARRVVIIE